MKTEKIKQLVLEEFGVSEKNLLSKKRYRSFVNARKAFSYLVYKNNELSLQHVGNLLGGLNHASVIHYLKCVNNHMETDKTFKNRISRIQALINRDLYGEERKENKEKIQSEFYSNVDWAGVIKELKQVYEK